MLKLFNTLCFFIVGFWVLAQNPHLEWVKQIGGLYDDKPTGVAIDNSNNVYLIGHFGSQTDFDPDSIASFFMTSNTVFDMFIAKYNSQGGLLWAKQIGNNKSIFCSDIKVDNQGNVFLIGSFNGTVDFNPGGGVFNLVATGSGENTFVVKLNNSGSFVWARQFYGPDNYGTSIDVDPFGNLICSGNYSSNMRFQSSASQPMFYSAGWTDMYIAKLDSQGNFMWSKRIGGNEEDLLYDIAVDSIGDVVATGRFKGTVDFDPGTDTTEVVIPVFSRNAFVLKLSGNGQFKWVSHLAAGSSNAGGNSLVITPSGDILSTGYYAGTADFNPDSISVFNLSSIMNHNNVYVSKLDLNGNFLWAKSVGGDGMNNLGRAIDIDDLGNVYITGHFTGSGDFDPGFGVENLTSYGWEDIFILKLDSLGDFSWVKNYGGALPDEGAAIAVDGAQSVIATGFFSDSVRFDIDIGIGTTKFQSIDDADLFFLKFLSCGSSSFNTSITNVSPFLISNALGVSYQWVDCDNGYSVIPGATSQQFQATQNGNYAVILSLNNCIDTSVCATVSNIGEMEFQENSRFILFPNPASNFITVKGLEKSAELSITSSLGQLICKKLIDPNKVIDISDIDEGLYVVSIKSDSVTKYFRLFVNR